MQNPSEPFEKVLADELEQISHLRQHRGIPPSIPGPEFGHPTARAFHSNLIGLSFSGGGIRSATFNLGILQGLARWGILPSIDYLSTVSGGGYIGSWLAAWSKRAAHGFNEVCHELNPENRPGQPAAEIQFLRSYSNYLTPAQGFLSADTWTMISIWLRNTLLNQIVLAMSFAAILLLPRVLSWLPDAAGRQHWAWGLSAVLLAVALWMIGKNLPRPRKLPTLEEAGAGGQGFVQVRIVLPLLFVCALLSAWIHPVLEGESAEELLRYCSAFGAGTFLFLSLLSHAGDFSPGFGTDRRFAAWIGIPSVNFSSSVVSAALLYALGRAIQVHAPHVNKWSSLVWGTPMFLLVFSVGAVAQIGLLGRNFSDDRREWWSRLGAWLLIYFLGWTTVFAAAILGPILLIWTGYQLTGMWTWGALAAWVATVAAGVLSGSSSKTAASDGRRRNILNGVAAIAPPVFIVGIILLASLILHLAIRQFFPCLDCIANPSNGQFAVNHYRALSAVPWSHAAVVMVALAAIAGIVGWRVDINEFSLHQFYRNRLVRCYLGASRQGLRRPNAFTGFDSYDDLDLRDLRPDGNYSGPYPLLNCALNLVHGKNLAWQERRATSFFFSPLYSGFDSASWLREHPGLGNSEEDVLHGYCPTNRYAEGTVKLGQACAISGAAASPNAGYHSSPAASFLMTVFDVRLGWWMANPSHKVGWKFTAPHFGFKYLLYELLGLTDANRRFVYLSDGGHFENLGVYELIRRRCRYVIACDAEQDPLFNLQGLGNLIRKCRTDFGVEIDINPERLRPDTLTGSSGSHCVIGDIVYPERDPSGERIRGRIIYIKASVNGDEPADVAEYKRRDPLFPHTPTSDQWFNESQFESYRRLGIHIANSVFRNVAEDVIGVSERRVMRMADRDKFFRMLAEQWYPPSSAVQEKFTEHSQALSALRERLRTDLDLRFLHGQISPEWPVVMEKVADPPTSTMWLPNKERELRAGFLYCNAILQLMENVYLDLNLEKDHEHPDNRGWMNLFNHWVWASMFRVTYAVSAATYGARFQTFCRKRLKLELGTLQVRPLNEAELNFYEKRRFEQIREAGDSLWALELLVQNPGEGGEKIVFRFGFAVSDANGCLAYYRVQNHLRNIGLWSQIRPILMAQPEMKDCQKLRRPPRTA